MGGYTQTTLRDVNGNIVGYQPVTEEHPYVAGGIVTKPSQNYQDIITQYNQINPGNQSQPVNSSNALGIVQEIYATTGGKGKIDPGFEKVIQKDYPNFTFNTKQLSDMIPRDVEGNIDYGIHTEPQNPDKIIDWDIPKIQKTEVPLNKPLLGYQGEPFTEPKFLTPEEYSAQYVKTPKVQSWMLNTTPDNQTYKKGDLYIPTGLSDELTYLKNVGITPKTPDIYSPPDIFGDFGSKKQMRKPKVKTKNKNKNADHENLMNEIIYGKTKVTNNKPAKKPKNQKKTSEPKFWGI